MFQIPGFEALTLLTSNIEGAVILVMSDVVIDQVRELVGSANVVLSIRESKGLEFTDVIIVDFFKNLPASHQKPWRQLMQGKHDLTFNIQFPEIETQMKQLYTAITRCSNNLFFAETGTSDAGQAFTRFLKERELAHKRDQLDMEKIVMTPDQYISRGIHHAMIAETTRDSDFDVVLSFLKNAMYCFQRAGKEDLERVVLIQKESVEFRKKHEMGLVGIDQSSFATAAASHLESLLKERLFLEGRMLCECALPLLDEYAQKRVKVDLLPGLPKQDGS